MARPNVGRPRPASAESGPSEFSRLGGTTSFSLTKQPACNQAPSHHAVRMRQAQHLQRCGPRCILEAMLAVDRGDSLDAVLADFERLTPETYHAALMLFLDGETA